MNRYIIVGPARSGTTVTHLCLAGHPNVSALNDEVKVHPFFTDGISTFTHGNDRETERRAGFLALFDTLCTLNRQPGRDMLACGLKTAIITHAEAAEFVKSVQDFFPGVRIILTLRDDIVAQFGSLARAKITGKWHSWVKPERVLEGALQIEENRLYSHAIEYLQTVRELQRLEETHEVFEISYEKDILPGDMLVYQRLFRFLNLPEKEVAWLQSRKVAPAPEEFIADYARHAITIQELRQRFKADPVLFLANPETTPERLGILQRVRRKFFRL